MQEGRDAIERVVEDGNQPVADARVGDESRVGQAFDGVSQQVDTCEWVRLTG
jgi:hypothetical protein